jgi:hypothetical protein
VVFSAEEAQLTEHLDEGIGLVVARRAVEGESIPGRGGQVCEYLSLK